MSYRESDFAGTRSGTRYCLVGSFNSPRTWARISSAASISSLPRVVGSRSWLGFANLNLDLLNWLGVSGEGRFEMQFVRFSQILESLFFRAALAGNVHIEALGNEPFAFAPDCG